MRLLGLVLVMVGAVILAYQSALLGAPDGLLLGSATPSRSVEIVSPATGGIAATVGLIILTATARRRP